MSCGEGEEKGHVHKYRFGAEREKRVRVIVQGG